MESLSDTLWDVVLSGTGLPQSLLALALSRSGKKVLHVDKNDYYGGAEAALSLQEAESWAESLDTEAHSNLFHHASLSRPEHDPSISKLASPRSYSLSLAPQIIYTRSNLLPALVSSKVYRQLDFLAVGNWYICEDTPENQGTQNEEPSGPAGDEGVELHKIPGSREDVFADKSIDLRSARSLMKFLKLATDTGTQSEILNEWDSRPFPEYLTSQFKVPVNLQRPLMALTLSPTSPMKTTTSLALSRINRHLTSIGIFGPGFGAVIPKWGGLAEVAQVACRAGAVGGGVYVLKRGIKSMKGAQHRTTDVAAADSSSSAPIFEVELDDGEEVRTHWVVGTSDHLPFQSKVPFEERTHVQRSIMIVSSPLLELFPTPVEGCPPLDGAIVVFPSDSLGRQAPHPPIYLSVYASGTGQCPSGQCVLYAAHTIPSSPLKEGSNLLDFAIKKFLASIHESPKPEILWNLSYQQSILDQTHSEPPNEHVIHMTDVPPGPVLEDEVLRNVRATWERIVGDDTGQGFMKFEDRQEGEGEEGD